MADFMSKVGKLHLRLDEHPEKMAKIETALDLHGNNSAIFR